MDAKPPFSIEPLEREQRLYERVVDKILALIQDGKLAIRMRHEAPRRFRISGRDIRPGARLVLFFTDDATLPPPHAQFDKMSVLDMPIYATSETSSAGHAIFETAVEAAPKLAYALLLGGPAAPGVRETFARTLQEPPSKGSFYPATWNRYLVFVVNEDGTFASGGWQALTFDG